MAAALETLLQHWRERLRAWSADGSLASAARHALELEGAQPLLDELVAQWAGGDFSALPPVTLLTASSMPGAAGAYAASTRTIYLNQDWLETRSADQITEVLTEELGHHLDNLINESDTIGDEGAIFSSYIKSTITSEPLPVTSGDSAPVMVNGQWIEAEQSSNSDIQPLSLDISPITYDYMYRFPVPQYGGKSAITGITSDENDNIWVSGWTTGDLTQFNNKGSRDAFIAKIRSDGTPEWTRLLYQTQGEDAITAIHYSNKLLFAIGSKSVEYDSNYNALPGGPFVGAIGGEGAPLWIRFLEDSSDFYGDNFSVNDISADAEIVAIGGWTDQFDESKYDAGWWQKKGYIKLYTKTGESLREYLIEDASYTGELTKGEVLSVDVAGNESQFSLVVGGWVMTENQAQLPSERGYLSRIDERGTKWTKKLGTTTTRVNALAVDEDDNIYVAGRNTNKDYQNYNADIFIAKYSGEGELLWETVSEVAGFQEPSSLTLGPNGEVIVTGLTTPFAARDRKTFLLLASNDGIIDDYIEITPRDTMGNELSDNYGVGIQLASDGSMHVGANFQDAGWLLNVRGLRKNYIDRPSNIKLGLTSDTGISKTDNITSDTTPTFTGTAEPGSTINLLMDGVLYPANTAVTTADPITGEWSYTIPAEHAATEDITSSLTVTATDGAGNTSEPSDPLVITIDLTPPVFLSGSTADRINENIGAGQVVYVAKANDKHAVEYALKTGNGDDADLFAIDASTGDVTLTIDPDYETQSSYAFTVVATDAAGNSSEQETSLTVGDLTDNQQNSQIHRGYTYMPTVISSSETIYKNNQNPYSTQDSVDLYLPFAPEEVGDVIYWRINGKLPSEYANQIYAQSITYSTANFSVYNGELGLDTQSSGDEHFPIKTARLRLGAVSRAENNDSQVYTIDFYKDPLLAELLWTTELASEDYPNPNRSPVVSVKSFRNTVKEGDFALLAISPNGYSEHDTFYFDASASTVAHQDVDAYAYRPGYGDFNPTRGGTIDFDVNNEGYLSFGIIRVRFKDDNLTENDEFWNLRVFSDASLTQQVGEEISVRVVDSASIDDLNDITSPVAPPTADLIATSDTGSSNTDNLTSDSTPTFTGTAEAGTTVELFADGSSLGSTTADGSGNWTFSVTAPNALTDGSTAITATATDSAGNSSPASAPLNITIDTTAPTFTSGTTAAAIDENSGAAQIIYTAEASDQTPLSFSLKAGAGDSDSFSINVDSGAVTLSADPDYETQSSYAFTVVATDAAGNASEQRVTLAINDLPEMEPHTVQLSIPSLSIQAGKSIAIPIHISDAAGIESLDLNLTYDSAVFSAPQTGSLITAGSLNPGAAFVVNDSPPGQLLLSWSTTNPLASGTGSIATLNLDVKPNASPGTTTLLDLVSASVNERRIGSELTDGTVTVLPPSFQITNVRHMPNGLALRLPEAPDMDVFNLYDGPEDAAVDQPDLALIDAAGTAVALSAHWQPSTNELLLLAAAPLADDSYTLTIDSRSDGLVSASSGELLDGDGKPGTAFTYSFSHTAPELALSILDTARGAGQALSLNGVDPLTGQPLPSGIPILLSSTSALTSLSGSLRYDQNLLLNGTLNTGADLPDDWSVLVDPGSAAGQLLYSASGTTAISGTDLELFRFDAIVSAAAAPKAAANLYGSTTLIEATATANTSLAVETDPGLVALAYSGDTTGNGTLSSLDASRVQRVVVALDSGFEAYDDLNPVLIGDTTGNGGLSSLDASRIQQQVVGLTVDSFPLIPDPVQVI